MSKPASLERLVHDKRANPASVPLLEGRRPDVDLVHRHFLAYPGYREELTRALPGRTALLGERDVVAAALLAEPARLIEYDLDLDPSLWAASQRPVAPAWTRITIARITLTDESPHTRAAASAANRAGR